MLSSVNGFMRKEAKDTSVYFYTRRGVPTRHKRTRTHANAKHNRHAHSQRTRTTRTIWKIKVADLSTRHTYAHSYICGHAGSSDVVLPCPEGCRRRRRHQSSSKYPKSEIDRIAVSSSLPSARATRLEGSLCHPVALVISRHCGPAAARTRARTCASASAASRVEVRRA